MRVHLIRITCCHHQGSILYMHLENNPIGAISNYEFVGPNKVLCLDDCGISSLQNIVFNAEYVYFNDNPLSIIRNVTFRNVRFVSLRDCGITLRIFKTWKNEITWIPNCGDKSIKWALFQNPLSWRNLKDIQYFLPPWVSSIMLDGGDYHGPVWL